MQQPLFSRDLRVFSCPNCGAPVQVAQEGGLLKCSYCGSTMELASRIERLEKIPAGDQQIGESKRLELLRSQDSKPLLMPPSLRHLLKDGHLDMSRLEDAEREWRKAQGILMSGESVPAAERMYHLTFLLYQHYKAQKDYLKLRATLDTASELLSDPRYIQDIRCMLARIAFITGDEPSAEKWLDRCNPSPLDIHMDSGYRFTRAYIATQKRQWDQVLRILGQDFNEIPIADESEGICGLFQANAHEQMGNKDKARTIIRQLEELPTAGRPFLAKAKQAYAAEGIELCPETLLVAPPPAPKSNRLARIWEKLKIIVNVSGFLFSLVLLVGYFTADMPPDARVDILEMGLVLFLWFGLSTAGMVLIRVMGVRRQDADTQSMTIPGKAEIISAVPLNVYVNDDSQVVKFHLLVTVEGKAPYRVRDRMVVKTGLLVNFKPGATVPVKVDSKKPKRISFDF